MNLAVNDTTILSSGMIAFLIGCMFGLIGMMEMYQIYPDVIFQEPFCYCPDLHKLYDEPRQTFSILGWLFALIPIAIWRIKIGRDNKKELQSFSTGGMK